MRSHDDMMMVFYLYIFLIFKKANKTAIWNKNDIIIQ